MQKGVDLLQAPPLFDSQNSSIANVDPSCSSNGDYFEIVHFILKTLYTLSKISSQLCLLS